MKPPKAAMMIVAGEPKPDESDAGKIIFPAPEGLDLESKKPGDTIEFVAECEIEDGGKLCLKKLNGIELEGGNEPKEAEKPAASFADSVIPQPA